MEKLVKVLLEVKSKMSTEYSELNKGNESVKESLSERGESMSDSGMVVKIRKGIVALRGEGNDMEIRVGVLMHEIWGGAAKGRKGTVGSQGGSLVDNDDEMLFGHQS